MLREEPVHMSPVHPARPFGGYKKSGNGREWGEFGFHDYLEIKGILGYAPDGAE
jgi:acyl-CoA reductase-like NAD-dependent aldehyde dehydrogenase